MSQFPGLFDFLASKMGQGNVTPNRTMGPSPNSYTPQGNPFDYGYGPGVNGSILPLLDALGAQKRAAQAANDQRLAAMGNMPEPRRMTNLEAGISILASLMDKRGMAGQGFAQGVTQGIQQDYQNRMAQQQMEQQRAELKARGLEQGAGYGLQQAKAVYDYTSGLEDQKAKGLMDERNFQQSLALEKMRQEGRLTTQQFATLMKLPPEARAGYASTYMGMNDPQLLAGLATLTPDEQKGIATAKNLDAKTLSENAFRADRLKKIQAEIGKIGADTELSKGNSEYRKILSTWFPKEAQARINKMHEDSIQADKRITLREREIKRLESGGVFTAAASAKMLMGLDEDEGKVDAAEAERVAQEDFIDQRLETLKDATDEKLVKERDNLLYAKQINQAQAKTNEERIKLIRKQRSQVTGIVDKNPAPGALRDRVQNMIGQAFGGTAQPAPVTVPGLSGPIGGNLKVTPIAPKTTKTKNGNTFRVG